jgi:peptidoglycan hydrolase-like protein with peptidoglycan-binding domain
MVWVAQALELRLKKPLQAIPCPRRNHAFKAQGLMMNKKLLFALTVATAFGSAAAADERTLEAQAALKALGYKIGAVDGSWGKKTEAAITEFAAKNGKAYAGEVTPDLWISLAAQAKEHFPMPYLTLDAPLQSNKSTNLLLTEGDVYKPENCEWLVGFYQDQNWGRANPVAIKNYQGAFKGIVTPDVNVDLESFERQSNELHDSLIATNQACYALNNIEACKTIIEVASWMQEDGAFVFNSGEDSGSPDQYYFTTKHILNPLLIGYSSAVEKVGKPLNHTEIGDWFYSALIQNSYDVFLPERHAPKDMQFRSDPENAMSTCEKYAGSFGHSIYHSLGLSLYGVMWEDDRLSSQAYDSLLYSINESGALSDDGVMLCEASRGSNAMMYSGATMTNILYIVTLARNQGVELESPKLDAAIEKAGAFLFDSAFDFSRIEPYASENQMSWCNEDYRNQCMYNAFGRIASFSWMRHFVDLYPESELTKRILEIQQGPVNSDEEATRVSGAIAKSNFMISEVKWPLPVEKDDNHESHTRSANGPQFLNIMDVNLISNVCAIP